MSNTLIEAHPSAKVASLAPTRRKSAFITYASSERPLAVLFKRWIDQYFADSCEAFLFEYSLSGGTHWKASLHSALSNSHVFIPLCSPESVKREWVIGEIGAAWMKDQDAIIPVMHSGMTPESLPALLQGITPIDAHSRAFASDFILLLCRKLGLTPGSDDAIDAPNEIQTALAEIQRRQEKIDLFVSAPVSSFGLFLRDHRSKEFRHHVADVIAKFKGVCGFRHVYPHDAEHMPAVAIGVHQGRSALKRTRRFVLILPDRLPTGCLAEAGFAQALDIPSFYFVHKEEHLPAFLRQDAGPHVRVQTYEHEQDIVRMIDSQGMELFDGLG